MLLKVSRIRNERSPLQRGGEAGAQHEQDPKGVRIPPSPLDLEGEAKEAPRLRPRASRAISVLPSNDSGSSDAPGTLVWEQPWTASPLPLPRAGGPPRGVESRRRPHLRARGACGLEAGAGGRERGTSDRPGVGLRVPVTATVTVALGNAFLRGGGRLLQVSQEASPGALRPVGIGSGTGSVEGGLDAQCRGERNSSGASAPPPHLAPLCPQASCGGGTLFYSWATCSRLFSWPRPSFVWTGQRTSTGPG